MTERNANTSPRPLVAGNWKMNGLTGAMAEITALSRDLPASARCDVMICPPATLLTGMAAATPRTAGIQFGGQDCHTRVSGAHTGDISAEMLRDAGATAVIVGHSERRAEHGESDAIVAAKAAAAYRAGLVAIICVGETDAQRKAGDTLAVVGQQLADSVPENATPETTVIAYEPVWAIGTGLTPTAKDVADVHSAMRAQLVQRFGAAGSNYRLLYGGSVKAANARELMGITNVNGALVGGASLKASDFLGIIAAYAD